MINYCVACIFRECYFVVCLFSVLHVTLACYSTVFLLLVGFICITKFYFRKNSNLHFFLNGNKKEVATRVCKKCLHSARAKFRLLNRARVKNSWFTTNFVPATGAELLCISVVGHMYTQTCREDFFVCYYCVSYFKTHATQFFLFHLIQHEIETKTLENKTMNWV